MNEKEFIQKLKQIKPNQDWVLLTKQRVFNEIDKQEQISPVGFINFLNQARFIFNYRLAVASFSLVFLLTGLFTLAQNSVPGELLYSLRKITEQTQKNFASEKEHNIKIVNNRLDDLIKISKNNSVKNLAPAINEYQASVSRVAEGVVKNKTTKNNPIEIKKVVEDIKNIESKALEVRSLGINIDENTDLDIALIGLIQSQVQELEKKVLTLDQIELLQGLKESIEQGKYTNALEEILKINENQIIEVDSK